MISIEPRDDEPAKPNAKYPAEAELQRLGLGGAAIKPAPEPMSKEQKLAAMLQATATLKQYGVPFSFLHAIAPAIETLHRVGALAALMALKSPPPRNAKRNAP